MLSIEKIDQQGAIMSAIISDRKETDEFFAIQTLRANISLINHS
jgi:hypothetical protein